MLRCKTFLTVSTWIHVFSSVSVSVISQTSFRCKPFVTHCTHIWSWLVITWMLSDIITISFSLHFRRSFACKIYSRHYAVSKDIVTLKWKWYQCFHLNLADLSTLILTRFLRWFLPRDATQCSLWRHVVSVRLSVCHIHEFSRNE